MSEKLTELCQKLPCRQSQITQLYNLYGYPDEDLVNCVYISGVKSSGKSIVVEELFNNIHNHHITINLVENYTTKVLLENILYDLLDSDSNIPSPLKCDNVMNFCIFLQQNYAYLSKKPVVIVFDKAERFRNMDSNLLPFFMRLKELSDLPISVILISELEFTKLIPKSGLNIPIIIYFPQYTKEELLTIMSLDYESCCNGLHYDIEFFKNFLDIFLSVFYRACRDLSELRYLAKPNFIKYCQPIINKEINISDVSKLWRHIAPILKASLEVVYLRMSVQDTKQLNDLGTINDLHSSKVLANNLELPFYAKFLLIAAYLASYNPVKEDKRLFMVNHGKKTKTMRQIKSKYKVSEQLNTQLGPKMFTFDRLLAIFYAILDEELGFNSNLLVQISSLVELQLLCTVGDSSTLDARKFKCNVSYEFIQVIAQMVGFNIRKYLYDFI